MKKPEALKPCPCGQTPKTLIIQEGQACKYAWVGGGCCGEWFVEFRTNYHGLDTAKCMEQAAAAWNGSERWNDEKV